MFRTLIKYFKEGVNETEFTIDIFKDKKTGDLLYRGPNGERNFLSISKKSSKSTILSIQMLAAAIVSINNSLSNITNTAKVIGNLIFDGVSNVDFSNTVYSNIVVTFTGARLSTGLYEITCSDPILTGAFTSVSYKLDGGNFTSYVVDSTRIRIEYYIAGVLSDFSQFENPSVLIEII